MAVHGEFDEMDDVRGLVLDSLQRTSLHAQAAHFGPTLEGGKMLRARLVLAIGTAAGVPRTALCQAGAAVELLHAASLVHDDIVDGGTRRRGAPALWVSDGARAAVLLGDLLVSLAVEGVQNALPRSMPTLVATLRDMCDAQAEQEYLHDDVSLSWDRCVSIARRKTGSLFGFSASCGGSTPEQAGALLQAGYALGTAYQLADDLLDARQNLASDKTLGTDLSRDKLTAVTAKPDGTDPREAIAALLRESEERLARWPEIQHAWGAFINTWIAPLVEYYTIPATLEAHG